MFRRFIQTGSVLVIGAAVVLIMITLFSRSSGVMAAPALDTTPTTGEIGVVGVGRVTAKPDLATALVGVQITAPTLDAATQDASARMTKVVDALKGQGVAAQDIQTSSYSVNPIQDYSDKGDPAKTIGYQVTNLVRIKIRAIEKTGSVLDAAIAAGANFLSDVSLGIADPKAFENEARTKAVQNARAKAQTIAAAAGVKLGRVLSMTDSPGAQPPPVFRAERGFAAAESAPGPVETGELEITVNVEMHWQIEQ